MTGSEGIWFSINDLPDMPVYTTGCIDTSVGAGCMWINRPENLVETKKTNAFVILYIRTESDLEGRTFELDGTNIYPTSAVGLVPAASNGYVRYGATPFMAAKNIADKINTTTKTGGSPAIMLKNRFTASAYLPDKHPWIDNAGINQYPVAAVKISIHDVATPFVNYPNYYAAGELGNSKIARLLNDTGSVTWALEGEDFANRNLVYSDEVYFHGGQSPKYEVESLADKLGFQKTQERLGKVAPEKIIKEAIVAVPFIEESGVKKFFNIQRRLFEIALGEKKKSSTEEEPGKSIISLANTMGDYVFPPNMDFYNNKKIKPFVMYIFEFEHKLSKRDLSNIWQNLPPEIATRFEKKEATITHDLLSNEFLRGKIDGKLRWMVFKVKQKAATNYYDITSDEADDILFAQGFRGNKPPAYSYNYPYDFFSLVELAELETEVEFSPKSKISTLKETGVAPVGTMIKDPEFSPTKGKK